MAKQPTERRLPLEILLVMLLVLFALGAKGIYTENERDELAAELNRRPAIGYPVFRGVRTVFITNFDIHDVYWLTDCPRMKDFTRDRAVAVYGDHLNRCHDWHFLDSDPLANHVSNK